MRKEFVISGFLFLFAALILALIFYEQHVVEVVVDVWDPVNPSLLYPENYTGWAFMGLLKSGDFLRLNISASESIRVLVGKLVGYNETTKELFWDNVIFNQTGKVFVQEVEIYGTSADFLAIINEGADSVTLSGNVKKITYAKVTFYPHLNLTTPIIMSGLILLIFGLVVKSREQKRLPKRLQRTVKSRYGNANLLPYFFSLSRHSSALVLSIVKKRHVIHVQQRNSRLRWKVPWLFKRQLYA